MTSTDVIDGGCANASDIGISLLIQRPENKGMLIRRKAELFNPFRIIQSWPCYINRVKQQAFTALKTRNHETALPKMIPLIHCFHFYSQIL